MKFVKHHDSCRGAALIFLLAAAMGLPHLAAGSETAPDLLRAGFGQVDITPPIGAIITGPGGPASTGTDDPLRARAMVVENGGRKLAIVGVDLVKIRRDLADQTIALVTEQTGITRDAVLICPSHNHSSPLIPADGDKAPANRAYIDTLPKLIADSIVQANHGLQPARMSIGRTLVLEGHINRRLISKTDGLVLNTWLKKLNDLQQVPQVLGSEGVIDPELWLARFDSLDGKMLGSLVNFTCHPCLHDRIKIHTWSADFPGVIAEHVAQAFGSQAVCVFTQGASGNIQPPVCWAPDWKERSAVFAQAAVEAARAAVPVDDPVVVDYARRDVDVPRCNADAQRPEAIARLGWRPESFEDARRTAAAMPRTLNVPVSAARIGPFAIATNAGELFVEWGILVKKRSPFPHTILSELTNAWIGYEPTEAAFQHEGYETLAGANFVAIEGIHKLVDTAGEMLDELWKQKHGLEAGVGRVDITPTTEVALAGSPAPKKTSAIKTRLYVRALVLSADGTKVAIVTLDTLKYPVQLALAARTKIEQLTGIPASHVIICSSHTHSGPLWSYYPDQLVTPIAEAAALAVKDLMPCAVGVAQGKAAGLAECRRVIKDGQAWNRWQLKADEADKYPAEGPADPEFALLAVTEPTGKIKAVAYNFACHAANNREPAISADFPGDVEQRVQQQLGYDVPALFLTGACGDVNPIYSVPRNLFGEKLGDEIVLCLKRLAPVAKPALSVEFREFQMPGREHPVFPEAEVARNWPGQLEHYRKAFASMKQREQPSYQFLLTGIRIGDEFAIVTNPNELFSSIAMGIKQQSPFRYTMTIEQTNGAHGYVPTAQAFANGSYETWFGEHSYLTPRAAHIIEQESMEMLKTLNNKQ